MNARLSLPRQPDNGCLGRFRHGMMGLFVLGIPALFALFAASCSSAGNPADGDSDLPSVECRMDTECDPGMFCSNLGRCLSQCQVNEDCRGGYYCVDGVCIECLNDFHCESKVPDAYCDADYHVCRLGCADCQADQICVNERCRTVEDGDLDLPYNPDAEIEEELEFASCPPPPDGMTCEPNCTECMNDTTSRQCRSDGSGFSITVCSGVEYCNWVTGRCESEVCDPGHRFCEENTAMVCKNDGTGYEGTLCEAPLSCISGECVNIFCRKEGKKKLFTFEVHSDIASPDRHCQAVVNRGSAAFKNDAGWGITASFDGQSHMELASVDADYREGLTLLVHAKRAQGSADTMTLLAKGDPPGYEFALENGEIVFRLNLGGEEYVLTGGPMAPNVWYGLAGSYDGESVSLYVNGERQGDPVAIVGRPLVDPNSQPLSLGSRLDATGATSRHFEGFLDNLYLFEDPVGTEDIGYFQETAVPCAPETEEETDALYCTDFCKRNVIHVPISVSWTNSYLSMKRSEAFLLKPGGCPDPNAFLACIPAPGLDNTPCPDCPVPGENQFSLIARAGESGVPVFAGDPGVYTLDRSGMLYFGYNDDSFMGHSGGFSVLVEQGYCRASHCPNNMTPLPGFDACIDQYEASCLSATAEGQTCDFGDGDAAMSQPGVIPWTNIDAIDANVACTRSGKRLCTFDEWTFACRGENDRDYPYGATHADAACNDGTYGGGVGENLLVPSGTLFSCSSEMAVFDLVGNAGEFVSRTDASGYRNMAGKGLFDDPATCSDYLSTDAEGGRLGFRCCKDMDP